MCRGVSERPARTRTNTDISATLNTAYTNASFGQVNAAYQDTNNTFDPGGRLGMIMFRFNW